MQTCVPVEKRSKKAQRAAVRANRVLWQGVKLCPRIMRKKTDYSRKGSDTVPVQVRSAAPKKVQILYLYLFIFLCGRIFLNRL